LDSTFLDCSTQYQATSTEYSLFSAYNASLKSGGLPVAFLTDHGTHGTGYSEPTSPDVRSDDMIQLDSTAYTISKDGSDKPAERGACMPHTSVVVFQPTYRFEAPPGTSSTKVKEVFDMGRNTPMPIMVEGAFKSVITEQKSYDSVKGTIFGFAISSWQKECSGDGLVCCF
jgi:alpha-acetolactate decarboxylase